MTRTSASYQPRAAHTDMAPAGCEAWTPKQKKPANLHIHGCFFFRVADTSRAGGALGRATATRGRLFLPASGIL